jgi:hypothetical protein
MAPLSGRDELYPRYHEVTQRNPRLFDGARVQVGVCGPDLSLTSPPMSERSVPISGDGGCRKRKPDHARTSSEKCMNACRFEFTAPLLSHALITGNTSDSNLRRHIGD